VRYLSNLGPVGQFMQGASEETRSRIIPTVRAAYDPYVHGDEVRFVAASWRANATA
jgi:hypothetical protein